MPLCPGSTHLIGVDGMDTYFCRVCGEQGLRDEGYIVQDGFKSGMLCEKCFNELAVNNE